MLPGMVMRAPQTVWVVDPDDPRAPPDHIWEAMTPAERQHVVDTLPSEFEPSEAAPPEGDAHFNTKVNVRETLGGYFARTGRRVYIAAELPVYYPGEKMFAPDVMAVLDVELKERSSWIVRNEGKGLDFALEIIVSGRRQKDLEENVERYARLGISEYFVFDRARLKLRGYRLPSTDARAYKPILAQTGLYTSHVLGLDMRIEGTKLRFFHAAAPIPDAVEMISSLHRFVDDIEQRLSAAEEQAAEESRLRIEAEQRAEEEARLRVEAEQKALEEMRLRAEEMRLRMEAEAKLRDALAQLAKNGGSDPSQKS